MSEPAEHDEGLHAPAGAAHLLERPRRMSARRLVIQLTGLAFGLGLFGWAIALSLSEENRSSLEAVRHAALADVVLLLALTFASQAANTLIFWIVLLPARRLSFVDMLFVNHICTLILLLPFKLSVFVRGFIHHRRDRVPFRDLLAWFTANALLGAAVLLPIGLAALWRGRLDFWFLVAGPGLAIVLSVGGWYLSSIAERLGPLHRLGLGADLLIRDPRVVGLHFVLRVIDTGFLAARFFIAARIAGVALDLEGSTVLGCGYFLSAIVAPAGVLGFAEMGTAGIGRLMDMPGASIAFVALMITASQTAVALVGSLIGVWVLRLDRLFLRPVGAAAGDGPAATAPEG